MKVSDKQIIDACKNSLSMSQAASKVKMHFNTFKRRAVKLGCYVTNQSGVGVSKPSGTKILLSEILRGEHPQYQTFKLKNRLLEEGVMQNECTVCSIREWNNKPLTMELDHIDGDRTNHKLSNLRLLCPNCHAQTDTYRAKNIKQ
jgi:hypothetical protein